MKQNKPLVIAFFNDESQSRRYKRELETTASINGKYSPVLCCQAYTLKLTASTLSSIKFYRSTRKSHVVWTSICFFFLLFWFRVNMINASIKVICIYDLLVRSIVRRLLVFSRRKKSFRNQN